MTLIPALQNRTTKNKAGSRLVSYVPFKKVKM